VILANSTPVKRTIFVICPDLTFLRNSSICLFLYL